MKYLKKFENYSEPQTLIDIIFGSPNHQILKKAILACGLEKRITDGEFTIFAPTDYAFKKLPQGTIESLLSDTEALTDILLYHLAPAISYGRTTMGPVPPAPNLPSFNTKALSTSFKSGQLIKTSQGDLLKIEIDGQKIFVNNMPSVHSNSGLLVTNAKIETADLEGTNGVVHVIDTVLMPYDEQRKIAGSKDYTRSNY